jgi:gag-polypeptide of LTR copia-type/Integrase core domain/GAG-pre-integrase domain
MANTNSRNSTNQNLTNFLLNGANYLTWAQAVKLALGGKSKLGHITGTTKAPTDKKDSKYDEWEANDLYVMSLLCNAMEPKVYEIFAFANSAKEMWESLYEMYGNSNNSSRIFEIQQKLVTLNQEPDQSVMEHFGKMKQLWEELRLHRPPAATINEYLKREEQDQVFRFLASLTPEFEETRRDILMRPELLSLNTVYAILQSEETRKKVMGRDQKVNNSLNNSENFANFSSRAGDNTKWNKGKDKKGNQPYCDHCNRSGHTKDKCWVLYPHLKPARNRPNEVNLTAKPEDNNVQLKLEQMSKQLEFLMKARATNAESSFSGPGGETSNVVKHIGNHLALSIASCSKIIVDSGATDNMFTTNKVLTKWQPENAYSHITVANGFPIPTNGSGKARIFSKEIDVTVVPELKANLLSISKCTNQWNCNVLFTPQKVIFQDRTSGKKIGDERMVDGLYLIKPDISALAVTQTSVSSVELWHRRLGHPSNKILQYLNLSLLNNVKTCDPCQFAKLHRLPFPKHLNKSNELFGLIHSDVWGNASIESKEGFKYFVTFIDDKSHATWLYLLKSKREVCSIFQVFCSMIENQFNTTIKVLRTDNGTEYMNHDFQTFLHSKGIMHQTSCVGTPQQNGVAERKNRHLLEVTRALLFSANLPKDYWSYAVLTGCYLINRLPSRVLDFQSPFEILYNRKADISHLRVFGCICFIHSQSAGKLDHHAEKCIFVGYSSTQKGYKCYSPKSRRLFVSRDVQFDEEQMYYTEERQWEKTDYRDFQVSPNPIAIGPEIDPECYNPSPLGELQQESPDENVGPNETEVQPAGEGELGTEYGPAEDAVRRSSRTVRPLARLQDFITYHTSQYPI